MQHAKVKGGLREIKRGVCCMCVYSVCTAAAAVLGLLTLCVPHTKCCSVNLPTPQRGLTPVGNMDAIGPGRKTSSNGACESAGRVSERLVAEKNATRGDHPMLTGNQEVKKTHYPYKEPRIDQRMYQAEIPPLQGGNSNRAVTRGSSSPRTGESVGGWVVIREE